MPILGDAFNDTQKMTPCKKSGKIVVKEGETIEKFWWGDQHPFMHVLLLFPKQLKVDVHRKKHAVMI